MEFTLAELILVAVFTLVIFVLLRPFQNLIEKRLLAFLDPESKSRKQRVIEIDDFKSGPKH